MDGPANNGDPRAGGEQSEAGRSDGGAAAGDAGGREEAGAATRPSALEPSSWRQRQDATVGGSLHIKQPSSQDIDEALLASIASRPQSLRQQTQPSSGHPSAGAMMQGQGQRPQPSASLFATGLGHPHPPTASIAPAPATGPGNDPVIATQQAAAAAPLASFLLQSSQQSNLPYHQSPWQAMWAHAPLSSMLPSQATAPVLPSQATALHYHQNPFASLQSGLGHYGRGASNSGALWGSPDWTSMQASHLLHAYGAVPGNPTPASYGMGHPTPYGSASSTFLSSNNAVSSATSGLPSLSAAGASAATTSTALPFSSATSSSASLQASGVPSSSGPAQESSDSAITGASSRHQSAKRGPDGRHATRLAIATDAAFLDPVHAYLRAHCIEAFASARDDCSCPGRGARASRLGQVGLRCAFCATLPREERARQAVCFPSKRETLYESVRNYRRIHVPACPCIPGETKAWFKTAMATKKEDRRPQKWTKAYYAEAALEVGIVESSDSKGLVFGRPPNTSGVPSEGVAAVIEAAANPTKEAEFWAKRQSASQGKPQLRKFEHLATEATRRVLLDARREASVLVRPEDFPTVSDSEFLVFKQLVPCGRPSAAVLSRRGLDPEKADALLGLRCKHCTNDQGQQHKGMWFPADFRSFLDSSFGVSVLQHLLICDDVPREIKDALEELRRLASEHNVVTKRGSKKKFLEKVWKRMKRS